MAEYLDHLLPINHFFNIAVDPTDFLLLLLEVSAALAADSGNDEQHQDQGHDDQNGQLPAVIEHHDEYADNRNGGGNKLGDCVAQHFPDGVCIVGIPAHEISVCVGIEEPDGQMLHFGEHIRPDSEQGPGGNAQHDTLIEIGAESADQINAPHQEQGPDKAGHQLRIVCLEHGLQIVVNDPLQEGGADDLGKGTAQNGKEYGCQ